MTRKHLKALTLLAVPLLLAAHPLPSLANPFGDFNAGNGLETSQNRPDTRPGGGPQDRHQQMMQDLGLSQDQMAKMKALHEQGKTQSQALHQQLKTKRQALMQYMQSPDANEAKARALHSDMDNIQRQLGEMRIKSWFQMRQIMTPEQVQKMQQMRQVRMQQREQGPGLRQDRQDKGHFQGRRGGGGFGGRGPEPDGF